jgi:hypothetical protein
MLRRRREAVGAAAFHPARQLVPRGAGEAHGEQHQVREWSPDIPPVSDAPGDQMSVVRARGSRPVLVTTL